MQHLIGSGLHQQKEPALCSPGSRGGHGQYLQAAYDLPERQSTLIPPDESGGGQPEHLVQVRLLQAIEPWGQKDLHHPRLFTNRIVPCYMYAHVK